MMDNGLLVVISGPSGAGKGTICRRLREVMRDLKVSVSATTRKPREGEKEGESYFFIDEEEFVNRINNDEFLEYARVYGNYYGTPKEAVFKQLQGYYTGNRYSGCTSSKEKLSERSIHIYTASVIKGAAKQNRRKRN